MEQKRQDDVELLIAALLALDNERECRSFLEDLLTQKELESLSQRMRVAKLLSEKTVYHKIVEETGASTATISRVNRCYNYGPGGYATVLKRVREEKL